MRRFVWFVLVIATLVASDCPFPTYGPGCTQHCQQDAYGTYCPDNSYRCEPHVGCSCDLLYGPYWGVNCNVPCNCNNRATACGQYTGDCACIDSWGTSCEYSCPSYNGNICNSKGTCVGQGTNANGTCACNKWISGDACQIGVTHTKTKSRSCGSPSSTVGRTASRTVSLSPTNTRAASPTASAAASLTLSASLSLTLSISSRNTATASLTNPRTMATLSPSSTRSSSAASRTSDGTLSRTVTPPPTKTRTSTGPRTPSTTPTALKSVTPTTSVSVSTTGTDTRSSSSEGTLTRRTISLTDTATVTHAVTPPKKHTRTRTRLQTVSGTSHPSRSVTPTSSAEIPTFTPTFSSERTPTVSDTRSAVYHLSVSVIVEAACNAVVDVVCWTDSPSSSTRGGALSVVLLQSAAAGGSDWTAATIQDSFPPNVAPLAQHSNATSNITSITRVVVQGKTIVNATNPLVTSGAVVVTLLAECPPIPNGLPSTPPAITASPESHNLAGTHMMGGVAAATSLMSGPDLLSSPIVWRSLIAIGVAALMGVCFALL